MDQVLGRELPVFGSEYPAVDAVTPLARGLSDMRLDLSLHQALHDRLPHSAAVRDAHEEFRGWSVTGVGGGEDAIVGPVADQRTCLP